MSRIVIDMMGSDQGSKMSKEAVLLFKERHPDAELLLVGRKEELQDMEGFEILDAQDVMKMEAGALEALRQKETSMVKAVTAMKERGFDAVVSAGGTGAFLSASALILKKIPGVLRPALVTSFPNLSKGGNVTILDVGASNANTAEEIAQFALMGSLYSQAVDKIEDPNVYLLSNGSEEGKGSPEGKEAHSLLKEAANVNFKGNIEASQVLSGVADVVVTDGYSGNILLKGTEGAAKAIGRLLKKAFKKNPVTMLGYLLAKSGIKELMKTMDPKKIGGALLLGVNGVVVKAHGNSDSEAFLNAIEVAHSLSEQAIVKRIEAGLKEKDNG